MATLAGPLPVAEEVVMTVFRAPRSLRRRRLVAALIVVAAAAYPAVAGATPTYEGGASAGWGYQEGDVLSANPGTWTSTTSISYSYAWFNENSVRLGTGPTYTVTGSDVGHQIYAAITASDGTAPSLTVNTPTVGPMRYRPPVNTEKPTVSGLFVQGSTLVASPGKWVSGGASTAPIKIEYAWNRGCSVGPKPDCTNTGSIGATNTLVLSAADLGRTISLSVSASYPDGLGGYAYGYYWLGELGRVISSSVKAGDTLSGTVPWTVAAPGVQTVAFAVGGAYPAVVTADEAGSAAFILYTPTLPNGTTNLALNVTWTDGTSTQVPLGAVTISNTPLVPPPVVVKPLIAKPRVAPTQPAAGKRMVVTFAVTRSDNGRPLTSGKMICDPSIRGKVISHAESFSGGKARLTFIVPRTAEHRLLKVKLTITIADQSATRIATYFVR